MIDYLNSLGSSQFLMRDSPHQWDSSNFNISKLFDAEPDHAAWVFFDHKIERCRHPHSSENDIVCLKLQVGWTITSINLDDVTDMILDMNDSFKIGKIKKRELLAHIEKAIYYKSAFYRAKSTHEKFKKRTRKIVKIKDMQKLTAILDINWLKVINDLFPKDSQWTEDDDILVDDIDLIKNIAVEISQISPEILAETFVLTFLYNHQWFYNSYPFDQLFARNRGTKKAYQRWESCLFDIQFKLSPALELLYSRTNSNKTFNLAAKNLAQHAIDESVYLIESKTNFTPEIKIEIINKLKSLTIVTGFDDEQMLSGEGLEQMYNELPLYGNESYFDTWRETLRFIKRLKNEAVNDWKFKTNKMAGLYITDVIYDKLYIPSKWLLYPWFHPFRPTFFNVATIFTKSIEVVLEYAKKKVIETWNINDEFLKTVDADELAFEWYEKWLDAGNTELKFGANRLTDQQLYWFALARKFYIKVHENQPQDVNPIGQLQIEYMHVLYKTKPGFQKAYNCSITEDEKRTYQEYQEKLRKIYSIYY